MKKNGKKNNHNEDEMQFFDDHGNKITRAQARRADRFDDLDRQTEIVRSLIQGDKNYKYMVVLEKEEQRRRGGIRQFINQQIADFLVPPAIRPEYEREREEYIQKILGCSKDHGKEIDLYNKTYAEKI